MSAFGVACIEEALELRDAGITKPILLMEGAFSDDELALASAQNFWLMVASPAQALAITEATLVSPVSVCLRSIVVCIASGFHPKRCTMFIVR